MKILGIMLLACAGIVGWHAATLPQAPSAQYLAGARQAATIAYISCEQSRGDLSDAQCSERAWSQAYAAYPLARPQAVAAPTSTQVVTLASSFAALEKESAETRACVADIRSCR